VREAGACTAADNVLLSPEGVLWLSRRRTDVALAKGVSSRSSGGIPGGDGRR